MIAIRTPYLKRICILPHGTYQENKDTICKRKTDARAVLRTLCPAQESVMKKERL